jgi:hypothetical protein
MLARLSSFLAFEHTRLIETEGIERINLDDYFSVSRDVGERSSE